MHTARHRRRGKKGSATEQFPMVPRTPRCEAFRGASFRFCPARSRFCPPTPRPRQSQRRGPQRRLDDSGQTTVRTRCSYANALRRRYLLPRSAVQLSLKRRGMTAFLPSAFAAGYLRLAGRFSLLGPVGIGGNQLRVPINRKEPGVQVPGPVSGRPPFQYATDDSGGSIGSNEQ